MLTAAQFVEDYPQFRSTPAAIIDRHLSRAALRLSAAAWGTRYDEGLGLVAAHLLTIRDRAATGGSQASGAVRRERITENDIYTREIEYQGATGETSIGYEATIYGQEFLQLQKIVVFPVRIF